MARCAGRWILLSFFLQFFIFSTTEGFKAFFHSRKSSRYVSSLSATAERIKQSVAEIETDYYSSDYDFLDMTKPLEDSSQSIIFAQSTLVEDVAKLNATSLAPKLSDIELLMKEYEEDNARFINEEHKERVEEIVLAYEESRGYAFHTNRTDDEIRAARRKAKLEQPNFPLERVIIAVFHEKSQTLRSLRGVDDMGLTEYRQWLAKARAKGGKRDPLLAMKAKLADKWLQLEPWASVMSQYLEQSMLTGRILYPKRVGTRVFPRARPTVVVLPDGEERFCAPPKPRVLVGGLKQVEPPEWPPLIVLDESCVMLDLADDKDAEQFLIDTTNTLTASSTTTTTTTASTSSSQSSSSSSVFAPLQVPSLRNWLKKEEELVDNPYHTTIAAPSSALPSSASSVSDLLSVKGGSFTSGNGKRPLSVFAVDGEELFVPSVFAAEDNDHEYFVVL